MYSLFPSSFQLGPLSMRWYAVMMVAALCIVALVTSSYVARRGQKHALEQSGEEEEMIAGEGINMIEEYTFMRRNGRMTAEKSAEDFEEMTEEEIVGEESEGIEDMEEWDGENSEAGLMFFEEGEEHIEVETAEEVAKETEHEETIEETDEEDQEDAEDENAESEEDTEELEENMEDEVGEEVTEEIEGESVVEDESGTEEENEENIIGEESGEGVEDTAESVDESAESSDEAGDASDE